jgi:hypothetical protein
MKKIARGENLDKSNMLYRMTAISKNFKNVYA